MTYDVATASGNSKIEFVEKTSVINQGIGVNATALLDTGAKVDLLMSYEMAVKANKGTGAKIWKLKSPIKLFDFRKQPASTIEHKMIMTFEMDGRRFRDQTFLITDTSHDIFVGMKWLNSQKVLLDCMNTKIIWPDDTPALAKFAPAITVYDKTRKPDPKHQRDADERDARMEAERLPIARIMKRSWRPKEPPPKKTHDHIVEEQEDAKLIAEIVDLTEANPSWIRWNDQKMPTEPVPLEIAALRAPDNWKTYDQDERIEFPDDEDPEHVAKVREKLPTYLRSVEGFFSKKQAHTLPQYRPGHDVVLELSQPLPATGPPSYRTPPAMIPLEKHHVDELLAKGFIESCQDGKYAAPVIFADKPHLPPNATLLEKKRFCIDFRWVNQYLKDRLYQAPSVAGTIYNCRTAKIFSKIDIIQAFHRLRLTPESEYLTAFKTRFGTYRWKVLPFGLKVGPSWFQQFINMQIHELLDFCASAYADDVLIHSDEVHDHPDHVKEVIHRLHKANLQGDIKKSRFEVTKVDYLGIILEVGKGVHIDPEKVEAITNWKFEDLTSVRAVRSFLGLINYVRTFCHHSSEIAEPLNRLMKKDCPWIMGSEQEAAFKQLQEAATTTPILAFWRPEAATRVETDASRNAVGGVLWQQQEDDQWKPVGYFSKTMTATERAYPIHDRELLAVVRTLEHFYSELIGCKFDVITDHQALLYFSSKQTLSVRQVRWSEFLGQFHVRYRYRPGKDNVAADALSRKTVDLPTVKAREQEERTMSLLPADAIERVPVEINVRSVSANKDDQSDQPRGADLAELIAQENVLQNKGRSTDGRLIVPEKSNDGLINLRTALIREAHAPPIFSHAGQNKVYQLVSRTYYWPEMRATIRRYVQNCHECHRNKIPRDKKPGLLQPLEVPSSVWEHVVVDGKSMPTTKTGYDYIWAFVCKLTRLIVRIPGKKTDTAEILAARYYKHVYRLYGLPAVWITDNGPQFVSAFLAKINEWTGTKHRQGSTYHPQSQGAVEITNQQLDQSLRFYVAKHQDDWDVHLPAVDFAHNATWHSAIGMCPIKAATGRDPRTPLDQMDPKEQTVGTTNDPADQASRLVLEAAQAQKEAVRMSTATQNKMKDQADKSRRETDFQVGDKVFLRKKGFVTNSPTTKLDSQFVGPFKIIENRNGSFVLDLPNSYKMNNLFHASRLRRDPDNPLPGQQEPTPEPEEIDGEPEWEVTRILDSRVRRGKLEYQVEWRGCDPDDEWYPARNFKNAPVRVQEFHDSNPHAAGPPINLDKWIKMAADNDNNGNTGNEEEDDKPVRMGTSRKTRRHV